MTGGLMSALRTIVALLAAGFADLLALLSLLAVGVGCWWLHPAAGLIVPGLLVFLSLGLSRLLGGRN